MPGAEKISNHFIFLKIMLEANVNHMTIQNVFKKDVKCFQYKKVKQKLLSAPM